MLSSYVLQTLDYFYHFEWLKWQIIIKNETRNIFFFLMILTYKL